MSNHTIKLGPSETWLASQITSILIPKDSPDLVVVVFLPAVHRYYKPPANTTAVEWCAQLTKEWDAALKAENPAMTELVTTPRKVSLTTANRERKVGHFVQYIQSAWPVRMVVEMADGKIEIPMVEDVQFLDKDTPSDRAERVARLARKSSDKDFAFDQIVRFTRKLSSQGIQTKAYLPGWLTLQGLPNGVLTSLGDILLDGGGRATQKQLLDFADWLMKKFPDELRL